MNPVSAWPPVVVLGSEHGPFTQELVKALGELGLGVFDPARDIKPGEPIAERLLAGIRNARAAVVILGEPSLSDTLRAEIAVAIEMAERDASYAIIPIIQKGAHREDLPSDILARAVLGPAPPHELAQSIFRAIPTTEVAKVQRARLAPSQLVSAAKQREIELLVVAYRALSRIVVSTLFIALLVALWALLPMLRASWGLSIILCAAFAASWVVTRSVFSFLLARNARSELQRDSRKLEEVLTRKAEAHASKP